MEYKILSAHNVQFLNKTIESKIKEGFEPIGTPFVFGEEICQTVQKTDATIANGANEAGVYQ